MTSATKTPTRQATVTRTGDRQFRVERIFDAPRERVWRAMTDAKLLAQWWGRGNPLDVEELDVRPGGSWRFVEHAGGATHGFRGSFREVAPPERLVQTFVYDGAPDHVMVNEMTLEDLGDGRTRLVALSLFQTQEELQAMTRSGMEAGMNQSYAALDQLLASL
ncbi:MAG TPA: SRPBCC family protein [Polyangia bacterium]|nr:SRPBCC family protein [Polyangia bacterium]